jgi:hypothetical protein
MYIFQNHLRINFANIHLDKYKSVIQDRVARCIDIIKFYVIVVINQFYIVSLLYFMQFLNNSPKLMIYIYVLEQMFSN